MGVANKQIDIETKKAIDFEKESIDLLTELMQVKLTEINNCSIKLISIDGSDDMLESAYIESKVLDLVGKINKESSKILLDDLNHAEKEYLGYVHQVEKSYDCDLFCDNARNALIGICNLLEKEILSAIDKNEEKRAFFKKEGSLFLHPFFILSRKHNSLRNTIFK